MTANIQTSSGMLRLVAAGAAISLGLLTACGTVGQSVSTPSAPAQDGNARGVESSPAAPGPAPTGLSAWYGGWYQESLDNLTVGSEYNPIPGNYVSRYSVAFYKFENSTIVPINDTVSAVASKIREQAPSVKIFAGIDPNANYGNCDATCTTKVADYLTVNQLDGVNLDDENNLPLVPQLVKDLKTAFAGKGLEIAVSVPWPSNGPSAYSSRAFSTADVVDIFNRDVDAIELQDYSASGTRYDAAAWNRAGVPYGKLVGGVSSEVGGPYTQMNQVDEWTSFAKQKGMQGMFSWRIDNDTCTSPSTSDPTFTTAKRILADWT